jgi:hypothetical protein
MLHRDQFEGAALTITCPTGGSPLGTVVFERVVDVVTAKKLQRQYSKLRLRRFFSGGSG